MNEIANHQSVAWSDPFVPCAHDTNGHPLGPDQTYVLLLNTIDALARKVAEIRGFALDSINIKLVEKPRC